MSNDPLPSIPSLPSAIQFTPIRESQKTDQMRREAHLDKVLDEVLGNYVVDHFEIEEAGAACHSLHLVLEEDAQVDGDRHNKLLEVFKAEGINYAVMLTDDEDVASARLHVSLIGVVWPWEN